MIKSFKYRIVTNRNQGDALKATLDACRDLYNAALEQRRYQRISLFAQMRQLKELRADVPSQGALYNAVQQTILERLNLAFEAFFRRCRSGAKPGYPRFKSFRRFDSFSYKAEGYRLEGNRLIVSKLGTFKLRLSRPLPGGAEYKRLTLKRSCGAWYAILSVECKARPLSPSPYAIGIDLGIEKFAATSDFQFIENPRIFERNEAELRRAQRRIARRKKGSKRREKARFLLRRIHERIANQRRDFLHKQSTRLIEENGTIAVEDLNIKGLVGSELAKQVSDVSWGEFLRMLAYKAVDAGRRIVEVDCRYTSQICPACGAIERKALGQRIHQCPCGYEVHRDIAAAQVILGRAGPSGANEGSLIPCVV